MNMFFYSIVGGLGGLLLGGVGIALISTILTFVVMKPTYEHKKFFILIGTLSSIGSTHILTAIWPFVAHFISPQAPRSFSSWSIIAWLVLPIIGSLLVLIPLAKYFRANCAQQGAQLDAGT